MTDGFFRLADDGTLLHAENFVVHRDYELRRDQRAEYTYPIHGWHWFSTAAEAAAFFGIQEQVDQAFVEASVI